MKRQVSRLKCAAIAALTLCPAFGARAEDVAEVTVGGAMTAYGTIGEAWSACRDQSATLKLLANVDITAVLDKSWMTDLSLDLNGHALRQTGGDRIIKVHGKLTVENGVITRSASFSGDGAGVCVCHNDNEQDLSRLVMRGVTMTNCVATGDGGAIYAERDTQVLLENCTLRQNSAGGSGGAIFTVGDATDSGVSPKEPWDKLVLVSTVITDNAAVTNGAGVCYKRTVKGSSCFAAGTLVRMADGADKKIEEVAVGDVVRTFDHEGGTNSSARVFLTVKEPITTRAFVLSFAGGPSVRCVLSHDFLMKDGDTCRYVCLNRKNAADYVGKSFYAVDGQWHELQGVTDGETVDEVYEIYTSRHLNSYADGLLTVPADVAHVLNVYTLGEDLKADDEQLAADIAQYGLADYAKISDKYGMSRAWYDDVNVKYGYVIIGKGLATLAQIEALYRSTQESGEAGVLALPKMAALPKLTGASDGGDPLTSYPASCLTLGKGTVVTNNLVGEKANNIYLLVRVEGHSLISLASDRSGICAGVTREPGQFTVRGSAHPGDIACFRSDDETYAVWYDDSDPSGSFLKLGEGSQIMPTPVAHTSYEIREDGEVVARDEAISVAVDARATVVYTAEEGYRFSDYATSQEFACDTSKSVAQVDAPEEPVFMVRVGDNAWAKFSDGICTVVGTGDMWSYDKAGESPLFGHASAITNLVVEDGVTGVGARSFENMWYLADVTLGASVTNVGDRAFKKCYGLTNVVSRKEGESRIGDYAFAGCHSLQALDFGEDGKPEFGEGAYAFRTVIYMRNGIPDIYPVPELTMGNYDAVKQGSDDLENWVEIDDETTKNFHFFRIVLEPKK